MNSAPKIAARKRLLERAAAMPLEPPTVAMSIRRELYLRELALPDLAARLHMTDRAIFERLSSMRRRKNTAMSPVFLNCIIAAIHITPAVARRLHLLAAREAGWNV